MKNSAITSLGTLLGSGGMAACQGNEQLTPIRFGICADIHLDTVYDGKQRLQTFITAMQSIKPDFILQMGDFCGPKPGNEKLLETWNRFNGPRYHVIGNHDTDGDYTKQQVVDFWKMPHAYYSFDHKGYHFIVLDGNDPWASRDPRNKYWSYVGDEQLSWLENDLEKSTSPVMVFIHQGLDNDIGGVENAVQVRAAFDRHNSKTGTKKVQLVFSGHHHQDYYNCINGIHYVQINSMSYKWLGAGYEHVPYSEAVNKEFTWTKFTAPYKDPLWAEVAIDASGKIKITGKQSTFVGETPKELGRPLYPDGYAEVPYISARELTLVS